MFGVLYVPQLIARCYLETMFAMGIRGRQRFFMGFSDTHWFAMRLRPESEREQKKNTWHNM